MWHTNTLCRQRISARLGCVVQTNQAYVCAKKQRETSPTPPMAGCEPEKSKKRAHRGARADNASYDTSCKCNKVFFFCLPDTTVRSSVACEHSSFISTFVNSFCGKNSSIISKNGQAGDLASGETKNQAALKLVHHNQLEQHFLFENRVAHVGTREHDKKCAV
jgi:hypothetical protein